MVSLRVVSESTIWSMPFRRRCRLGTITGVSVPSRSRWTSISTGPISLTHGLRPESVAHGRTRRGPAVLMAEVLGHPRCQGGLEHVLGELVSRPSGFTRLTPCSLACQLSSRPMISPVAGSIITSPVVSVIPDTAISSQIKPDPTHRYSDADTGSAG